MWFTDFVGFVPMPAGGAREAFLTADYNAEMIEPRRAANRGVRDRAIFVGNPERHRRPTASARACRRIRDWTEEHFDFSGYIIGLRTRPTFGDRAELRDELGYRPDERVCIVTVGGSGVGAPLDPAHPRGLPARARKRLPELRMIVVAGPRIDPAVARSCPPASRCAPTSPDLDRHLAACDLAVVQGGLTTCMELAAARRPVPLLPARATISSRTSTSRTVSTATARDGSMDYATATPEVARRGDARGARAAARLPPVETDGAARAARLIAELL